MADAEVSEEDWRELLNRETEEHERSLRKEAVSAGMLPMTEALKLWIGAYEAEQKDPDQGRIAKTGIAELDEKTKLRAGEMTIIAGRPSMGKSALAMQIAISVSAKGDTVAVFSLEMTAYSLIERMVGGKAGVNLRERIDSSQWNKITKACDELSRCKMFVHDRAKPTVREMHRALVDIPEVPNLIVVDYLGLVPEDRRAQRHDLAVGFNARDIRALAKECGAHALVLCQLNRKVEDRKPARPQLSDLRDSGNIEEHADNVWMLYREGFYNRDVADTTADIQIEKQRQGERCVVKVGWVGKYQSFVPLERRL